jgi:hypothetical protein
MLERTIRGAASALLLLAAACGDTAAPITPGEPTAVDLAGRWRMQSFAGKAVPGTYRFFPDEPTDQGPRDVTIRLDSAKMTLTAGGRYLARQYCFSELHDTVVRFRYCWGDHGTFTLAFPPGTITLTSEFIENLSAAGTVTSTTTLSLTEELWTQEEKLPTVWVRTP